MPRLFFIVQKSICSRMMFSIIEYHSNNDMTLHVLHMDYIENLKWFKDI